MQRRLDKAVSDRNQDRIRHITYLLSRRSQAVKIVAIERVTRTNAGKHTAGVDGIATPKDRAEADRLRQRLLAEVDIRKRPLPIRRVYIPKSNGKKRPLGISTLQDRVIQAILRITLEPIAEYHFVDCSYGFRPKRSCQDAIEHIFRKVVTRRNPPWIIEGDIRGCFDHIRHDALLEQMTRWQIPASIRTIVQRMLNAGILEENGYAETPMGTPQGNILSPLLTNMALTLLDQWGAAHQGPNPIVRYADDFIVTAQSKTEAEEKTKAIRQLLDEQLGLDLSVEKTRITHIHEGFDFLGFHIRKYRHRSPYSKYHQTGQLLIKPQKEKVTQFLAQADRLIRSYRGRNLSQLLRVLNPKLSGFTNYYRFVVSKQTFQKITHEIWGKLYRWLRKSHPSKSAAWIWRRYVGAYKPASQSKTFQMRGVKLYLPLFMPITRYRKVKSGIRVYDQQIAARVYWQQRAYRNALSSIYSIRVEKLYKRQRGTCPLCRQSMQGEQIRQGTIQIHHLNPQTKRDDHRLSNLRLLHDDCHQQLHRILSRDEMAELADQQIDYCQPNYLYPTTV